MVQVLQRGAAVRHIVVHEHDVSGQPHGWARVPQACVPLVVLLNLGLRVADTPFICVLQAVHFAGPVVDHAAGPAGAERGQGTQAATGGSARTGTR